MGPPYNQEYNTYVESKPRSRILQFFFNSSGFDSSCCECIGSYWIKFSGSVYKLYGKHVEELLARFLELLGMDQS